MMFYNSRQPKAKAFTAASGPRAIRAPSRRVFENEKVTEPQRLSSISIAGNNK